MIGNGILQVSIIAKQLETDIWLVLDTNGKSYTGSLTALLDLILSYPDVKFKVSDFDGLYLICEQS